MPGRGRDEKAVPWWDADDGPPTVRAVEKPTQIGPVGPRAMHVRTVLVLQRQPRGPWGELLTVRCYEDGRWTVQVGYWKSATR